MTTHQRGQLLIGVFATLLSGAMVFGLGAAWSAKEDKATADQRATSAALEREGIKSVLRRVDERTARTDSAVRRVERYLCRNRPQDLGC